MTESRFSGVPAPITMHVIDFLRLNPPADPPKATAVVNVRDLLLLEKGDDEIKIDEEKTSATAVFSPELRSKDEISLKKVSRQFYFFAEGKEIKTDNRLAVHVEAKRELKIAEDIRLLEETSSMHKWASRKKNISKLLMVLPVVLAIYGLIQYKIIPENEDILKERETYRKVLAECSHYLDSIYSDRCSISVRKIGSEEVCRVLCGELDRLYHISQHGHHGVSFLICFVSAYMEHGLYSLADYFSQKQASLLLDLAKYVGYVGPDPSHSLASGSMLSEVRSQLTVLKREKVACTNRLRLLENFAPAAVHAMDIAEPTEETPLVGRGQRLARRSKCVIM